jgi:hypothetical protein
MHPRPSSPSGALPYRRQPDARQVMSRLGLAIVMALGHEPTSRRVATGSRGGSASVSASAVIPQAHAASAPRDW